MFDSPKNQWAALNITVQRAHWHTFKWAVVLKLLLVIALEKRETILLHSYLLFKF